MRKEHRTKSYWRGGLLAGAVAWLCLLPISQQAHGVILATNGAPLVEFIAVPADLQLLPRDPATDTAALRIAGKVLEPSCTAVRVRVYRDDVLLGTEHTINLEYVNGVAAFCTRTSIVAELAKYDFDVYLDQGTNSFMIASAENIVAGDVYIHNGQSNAQAPRRPGEPSINAVVPHTNNWIRSFGSREPDPVLLVADGQWHIAGGDQVWGPGEIGQWALVAAKELVDEHGIPIAIISQANAGVGITFFQRNDAQHEDLTTNYGRLLWRCRQAGVMDMVRGALWYQGEADARKDISDYLANINALYADWMENYPAIENVYIHQLKVGCGSVLVDEVEFRDAQIDWANSLDDVRIMSTTAVGLTSDGCHTDTAANLELGMNLYRVMSSDLYEAPVTNDVHAPEIGTAWFSTATSNEIVLRNRWTGDQLTADSGTASHFQVHGVNPPLVSSVIANGNVLRLQLGGTGAGVNAVTYKPSYDFPTPGPEITNDRGIGLLAFFAAQVSAYVPPAPGADDDEDGLPNAWEETYFGNVFDGGPDTDSDGDGVDNWGEFLSGTDPNNPTSVFCVTTLSVDSFDAIGFASSTERTYTIQFCADLDGGEWEDLASGLPGAPGHTVFTNAGNASQSGFYRVLMTQP